MLDLKKSSNWQDGNHAVWALVISLTIVAFTSLLARAALNLKAATIDKPDLAVYLLLPDEGITDATLLRATEIQRDYMVETKNGPKLVRLQKKGEWELLEVENLHE